MKSKPKGFGPQIPSAQEIDQALQKLEAQMEEGIENLQVTLATPSGKGEIDALLGRPPASKNPDYQAAYQQTNAKKLLVSPQEAQALEAMKPFIKELIACAS